ncbi:MAG TPA: phage tail assembly protein [Candidatus Binatia bacterium]|nr:phage tail assembly protein [Candidatus Binatia bacterium]
MSTDENREAEEIAAQLMQERQWPVIVTLKHPVDYGSERISTLEFRRGCLADLKGMTVGSSPTIDQLLLVASRMCGQPLKVIEKLGDEDGAQVMEIAIGFLGRSLGAGKRR